MKSKKLFKSFRIDAGTYDFGINFLITQDINRAVKFVNHKLEETIITKEAFNCLGKRFYRYGWCPVIWIPEIPTTPNQIGTICHEIFHVVCDIMRWANIPLSNDTEEAYCHLIKHITKKFFEKATSN